MVLFEKKHVIDVPLEKEAGYFRVVFQDAPITGELVDAALIRSGKPVKVLAFHEPHTIGIDKLSGKRKSTVPFLGKILGLLPNIICFVLIEDEQGVRVAPQLNGLGMSENARLIKELLKVDDILIPESLPKSE